MISEMIIRDKGHRAEVQIAHGQVAVHRWAAVFAPTALRYSYTVFSCIHVYTHVCTLWYKL